MWLLARLLCSEVSLCLLALTLYWAICLHSRKSLSIHLRVKVRLIWLTPVVPAPSTGPEWNYPSGAMLKGPICQIWLDF